MEDITFNEITIEHKELFDDFFKRYPSEISEFTFTGLFCWRHSYSNTFAIFKDHLLISSVNKECGRIFYQPIGPNPSAMITEILTMFPESSFYMVEKKVAEELANDYDIVGDRANYDYVYEVEELRALKGNKYDAKRAFIKKFGGYYAEVCELDASTAAGFIKVEDEWCILRECAKKKSLNDEDIAVREALTHFQELGLIGICLRIWGDIKGFAIGEPLNKNMFVEHFEKASIGFNGIYQALLNEYAKKIPNEFTLLNREADMGVEGLRKAKESYHPVKMIEKFIVKKKAQG